MVDYVDLNGSRNIPGHIFLGKAVAIYECTCWYREIYGDIITIHTHMYIYICMTLQTHINWYVMNQQGYKKEDKPGILKYLCRIGTYINCSLITNAGFPNTYKFIEVPRTHMSSGLVSQRFMEFPALEFATLYLHKNQLNALQFEMLTFQDSSFMAAWGLLLPCKTQ